MLAETAGMPPGEVRAALRAAYPFGVRRYHPYPVWCDEVKIQTGRRKLTLRMRHQQDRSTRPADERQGMLPLEEMECL